MKALEKGPDKLKKISEDLRYEVLEPAHREAELIIEEAKLEAQKIMDKANVEAEQNLELARKKIGQERNVFENSLLLAGKQAFVSLKQNIENKLFNTNLNEIVKKETPDCQLIASIINAIILAVENEGLSSNFKAYIPKLVPAEKVNQFLLPSVLSNLENQSVELGEFATGAKVTLCDKNITLDISDEALKELLSSYVRKDFRHLIFAE